MPNHWRQRRGVHLMQPVKRVEQSTQLRAVMRRWRPAPVVVTFMKEPEGQEVQPMRSQLLQDASQATQARVAKSRRQPAEQCRQTGAPVALKPHCAQLGTRMEQALHCSGGGRQV